MFGFRFSSSSRRLKKPVRLHATLISVLSMFSLVISVVFFAAKAIVSAIVPAPLKQDTVRPWLLAMISAKIQGIKAWLYSMYSRWHIDTGARVFATLTT